MNQVKLVPPFPTCDSLDYVANLKSVNSTECGPHINTQMPIRNTGEVYLWGRNCVDWHGIYGKLPTQNPIDFNCRITCPAWDSEPGLHPNPPSKFIQDKTNSMAFSTLIASSLPYKKKWSLLQLPRHPQCLIRPFDPTFKAYQESQSCHCTKWESCIDFS